MALSQDFSFQSPNSGISASHNLCAISSYSVDSDDLWSDELSNVNYVGEDESGDSIEDFSASVSKVSAATDTAKISSVSLACPDRNSFRKDIPSTIVSETGVLSITQT